jgi:two-component system, NarL family, response regulator YdfI
MTRVLVAASSAVARAGLEAILARDPSFVVVGGTDGRGASPATIAEQVEEYEPDVVLLELPELPGDDDALAELRLGFEDAHADISSPAVVLLVDGIDGVRADDLLRRPVRGVLPRGARAEEILAATRGAAAGLVVVAPQWAAGLLSEASAAAPTAQTAALETESALTPREQEVLRMIADGLANKQIAARLGISDHTVKFHVASIFAKLRVSTRAEAVMLGARRGLIVL